MDYDFRRRITMTLVNPDTNSIVIPDLAFAGMANRPRWKCQRIGNQ